MKRFISALSLVCGLSLHAQPILIPTPFSTSVISTGYTAAQWRATLGVTSGSATNFIVYTNIAEMLSSALTNSPAYVISYYGTDYPQPRGGGWFVHTTSSSYVTNFGTVFESTSGGRWIRALDAGTVTAFDFGSKGNNVQNDAPFIQNAINTSISNQAPVFNKILFPPGTYKLDSMLYVANWNGTTFAQAENLTLAGTQLGGQNGVKGMAVLKQTMHTNAVIGVHMGRFINFDSLCFVGVNTMTNVINDSNLDMSYFDPGNFVNTGIATNPYAGHNGIVIDFISTNNTAWYTNLSHLYLNAMTGSGSARIKIQNCWFEYLFAGVSVSQATGMQQGEDIVLENNRFQSVRTAIASGQSQVKGLASRNSHVQQAYNFYDSTIVGSGNGRGIDVFGGDYTVLYELWHGSEHGSWIGGYAENFATLGTFLSSSLSNPQGMSFIGLQMRRYNVSYQAEYFANSDGLVPIKLQSCTLENDSVLGRGGPFVFMTSQSYQSPAFILDACTIVGGAAGFTTNMQPVVGKYNAVVMKDCRVATGISSFNVNATRMYDPFTGPVGERVMPGHIVQDGTNAWMAFEYGRSAGATVHYPVYAANVATCDSNLMVWDSVNALVWVTNTSANPIRLAQPGDALIFDNTGMSGPTHDVNYPYIGRVRSVEGSNMCLDSVAVWATNLAFWGVTRSVMLTRPFHKVHADATANITNATSVIEVFEAGTDSWAVGDRIVAENGSIPQGAYITNVSGTLLGLSTTVTASSNGVRVFDAKLQRIVTDDVYPRDAVYGSQYSMSPKFKNIYVGPVWDDLVVPGLSLRATPTVEPDVVVTTQGSAVYGLGFQETDQASGAVQMPHAIARTNSSFPNLYVQPHLHVSLSSNTPPTATNMSWTMEYEWANIGSNYLNFRGTNTTVYSVTTRTNQGEHHLVNFGFITNNLINAGPSSVFRFQLTRNAIAGTNGIPAANYIILDSMDLHVPVQSLGSVNPSSY